MLRIFAVTTLAIAMSVGLADAKGHKHKAAPKASLAYCQTDQQAKADCACGPAKTPCQKGMWCHAFASVCRP
jgi:hypothetical protein